MQLLPSAGGRPAVYGEYLHAPGAPTALIYAHYDVQPAADTAPLWDSPPFAPEVRGDRVWGRGASDDKGDGVLPPLQAIEAVLRSSAGGGAAGRLPLNIKVLLEGEEEIGSPNLEPFLQQHAKLLACDFVLSADGGQMSETQPSLTLGLRCAGRGGPLRAWRLHAGAGQPQRPAANCAPPPSPPAAARWRWRSS